MAADGGAVAGGGLEGRTAADGGAGLDGGPAVELPDAGARPPTAEELEALAEKGRQVYRRLECGACHSTDGSDGTAPTLLGLWGKTVKLKGGETVVADEAYVRESILRSGAKLVDGYPPLMPIFKDVLTPEEVDLLVVFIRALGDDDPAAP